MSLISSLPHATSLGLRRFGGGSNQTSDIKLRILRQRRSNSSPLPCDFLHHSLHPHSLDSIEFRMTNGHCHSRNDHFPFALAKYVVVPLALATRSWLNLSSLTLGMRSNIISHVPATLPLIIDLGQYIHFQLLQGPCIL